jgi:FAD/FMN-containing dehydrogenase
VLLLAMQDIVWHGRCRILSRRNADAVERATLGINLVEFCGDDPRRSATSRGRNLRRTPEQRAQLSQRLGHTLAVGAGGGRARSTACASGRSVCSATSLGEARPQPFVEDTAVPPAASGRLHRRTALELLDSHGLQYGMFGHVDAGVLHVRPILDMKDPQQAALVRPVSDGVAAADAQRYGGLLWGEHGKGLRSEYSPAFFGELYRGAASAEGCVRSVQPIQPRQDRHPSGQCRCDSC